MVGGGIAHRPAARLARSGEPRVCQGTVLCGWTASTPDGAVKAKGTNVYEFTPDGRIDSVTGFSDSMAG